jgi:hypothetical protein
LNNGEDAGNEGKSYGPSIDVVGIDSVAVRVFGGSAYSLLHNVHHARIADIDVRLIRFFCVVSVQSLILGVAGPILVAKDLMVPRLVGTSVEVTDDNFSSVLKVCPS